jgi:hypothetical protein
MILTLPADLAASVERLDQAEGISPDAFALRAIEDVVGWTDRAGGGVGRARCRMAARNYTGGIETSCC